MVLEDHLETAEKVLTGGKKKRRTHNMTNISFYIEEEKNT